MVTKL